MDEIRLTEQQKKLITDNYRLLVDFINKSIEKKVIPKYMEDDFISDMFLKFCLSALKFDAETGFKFSTYAYHGFKFGLKDIVTRKKAIFHRVSYSDEIEECLIEYHPRWLRSNELNEFISKTHLSSINRAMMEDYYHDGLSLREIGKKNNISGEAVRLKIKQSLKTIRYAMRKKEVNIDDFYQ